jgi:hypothetical protein
MASDPKRPPAHIVIERSYCRYEVWAIAPQYDDMPDIRYSSLVATCNDYRKAELVAESLNEEARADG